jgi:hypothetical protein
MNITQNISFLINVFQKIRKISRMNCITNWPCSKKCMKALKELLGYINQLGNSNAAQ